MEQAVPWSRLVARLAPLYPKGERGRPPIGLERMLRVYFVQQWYGLADEAVEDALYDSQALRGFAGIALNRDPVPDATTVLHFRHWLERHDLTKELFDDVGAMLEERGLLMRQGTIVDARIIAAPSSTKNKQQSRDPEMHQTKKGNQWYFGMKAHIGVDVASGLVHTVVGTAANEADITQTAAVLHGQEEDVFGDAGYTGADMVWTPQPKALWMFAPDPAVPSTDSCIAIATSARGSIPLRSPSRTKTAPSPTRGEPGTCSAIQRSSESASARRKT